MQAAIEQIKYDIKLACESCDRDPSAVKLVAVSKNHSGNRIREAYRLGLRDFGENYAQEFAQKVLKLTDLSDICWHFIGHLQTNKIKLVVGVANLIHSVDSLKLAHAINDYASKLGLIQDCLFEINLSGDVNKTGCDLALFKSMIAELSQLANIRWCGLMSMSGLLSTLKAEADVINHQELMGPAFKQLSMGMSGDYLQAIKAGSTIVRIGTALFGERHE